MALNKFYSLNHTHPNPHLPCNFADALVPLPQGLSDCLLDFRSHGWPPQLLTVRLRTFQSRIDSLSYNGSFELGENTTHLEHGPTRGRGCVNSLLMQIQVNP